LSQNGTHQIQCSYLEIMKTTDFTNSFLKNTRHAVHGRTLVDIVQQYLNDPDWLETIAVYLRNMQSGFYPRVTIDEFFQKWEGHGDYELVDAVAYMLIHTDILSGKIAKTMIDVGSVPFSDDEVIKNGLALSNGLSNINVWGPASDEYPKAKTDCSFSGAFWGKKEGEDGYIEWKDDAVFWLFKDSLCNKIRIAERRVPLEVGYTMPGRTVSHLMTDRAIARWPYGSKMITILVVQDNDAWRPIYK
jgi:hypothetical protein